MKEGYCVDLRIFLTVEPLLAAYKMICVVLLQKVKMNPIGVMALAGIMKVGISFIGG